MKLLIDFAPDGPPPHFLVRDATTGEDLTGLIQAMSIVYMDGRVRISTTLKPTFELHGVYDPLANAEVK